MQNKTLRVLIEGRRNDQVYVRYIPDDLEPKYAVSRVTWLAGSVVADTIIEVSSEPEGVGMLADVFLAQLNLEEAEGAVQIYHKEKGAFYYQELDEVQQEVNGITVLQAGETISTGDVA